VRRTQEERRRREWQRILNYAADSVELDKLDTHTRVLGIDLDEALDAVGDTAKRQVSRLPLVAGIDGTKRIAPKPLKRELEGRGKIAEAAEWLKRHQLSDARLTESTSVPGAGPLARDALDIATQAVPSTYLTAAGITEAAQGNPRRIKKLWKDYKETSAIPAAVEGNFREALERAQEHPLSTGLELSGLKSGLGRTTGGAMRRSPSRTLREKASLERDDLRLYPRDIDTEPRKLRDIPSKQRRKAKTGPRVERRYSRDVFNKGLQRVAERVKRMRGRDPDVDYAIVPSTLTTRRRCVAS